MSELVNSRAIRWECVWTDRAWAELLMWGTIIVSASFIWSMLISGLVWYVGMGAVYFTCWSVFGAPIEEEIVKTVGLVKRWDATPFERWGSCVLIGGLFGVFEVLVMAKWGVPVGMIWTHIPVHAALACFTALLLSARPTRRFYLVAIIPSILIHGWINYLAVWGA